MKLNAKHSIIGIKFRENFSSKDLGAVEILGYIQTTKGIAEISKGKFGDSKKLYNVSIIEDNMHISNLDKSLDSYSEALKYTRRFIFKEDLTPLKNLLENLL